MMTHQILAPTDGARSSRSLDTLPVELLTHIVASACPKPADLIAMQPVSKLFLAICSQDVLWRKHVVLPSPCRAAIATTTPHPIRPDTAYFDALRTSSKLERKHWAAMWRDDGFLVARQSIAQFHHDDPTVLLAGHLARKVCVFKYVQPHLWDTKPFMVRMLGRYALSDAGRALGSRKDDEHFMLRAASLHAQDVQLASARLRESKDFIFDVLTAKPVSAALIFSFAAQQLRDDESFAAQALCAGLDVFASCSPRLRSKQALALQALALDSANLAHVATALRDKVAFGWAVLKLNIDVDGGLLGEQVRREPELMSELLLQGRISSLADVPHGMVQAYPALLSQLVASGLCG